MSERNAFERQLADEIGSEVGPPRSVDAMAIARRVIGRRRAIGPVENSVREGEHLDRRRKSLQLVDPLRYEMEVPILE